MREYLLLYRTGHVMVGAVAVRRADGQRHRTVLGAVVVVAVQVQSRARLVALGTSALLTLATLTEQFVGTPTKQRGQKRDSTTHATSFDT